MHERAKFNMSTGALRNDLGGQVVHISMVYIFRIDSERFNVPPNTL